MPFRFTGDSTLTYPQYLNNADDTTLTADPGATYDMRPAGSLNLPLPPADGRWEPARPVPPGPPPPPLMTAASTEDEGK